MSEESKVNHDIDTFERTIAEKIDMIRELLQEEDKSVVEEIVMKKSHQP